MEQDKSLKYHIEMYESTPFIELMFQPTVPLGCCVESQPFVIPIVSQVGLTVSSCSLAFTADDCNSTQAMLRIAAVRTAGRNSRIMSLEFGSAEAVGLPRNGYTLHRILVQLAYSPLLL